MTYNYDSVSNYGEPKHGDPPGSQRLLNSVTQKFEELVDVFVWK